MEKYDIVEQVSSYLHAIGRIVVIDPSANDDDGGFPAVASTPPRPPPRTATRPLASRPEPVEANGGYTSFSGSMLHYPGASYASPSEAPPPPVSSARHPASPASPTPPPRSSTMILGDGETAESKFSAQSALGSAALTSSLGSCILVARTDETRGVLLTTSFVLATRREAGDAEAIFFETKNLGARHVPTHPVRVRLRPERLFFTSAPEHVARMSQQQRRLHAASVGYTVVACDIQGAGRNPPSSNNLLAIRPLTLPLLASSIPPISVNDLHLVVSHIDGVQRRCNGFTVEESFDGHSTYTTSDIAATFASGGAVFDRRGEFIALNHEFGDDNYCIHIASIVQHLYHSLVLGRMGLPVVTRDAEGHHMEPREHDGSVTGIESIGVVVAHPYGNGSAIADMQLQEFEHARRSRPVRQTLVMRDHMEIFNELYDPNDVNSLVLLLHGFHTHTKLLTLIFDTLLSSKHRSDLHLMAKHGGIGILLESIASQRAYDPTLMGKGLSLVGRLSLYEDNNEALSRYSGVQTILSSCQEYINTPEVVQWGVYALLNLVQPDCQRCKENISAVASFSGIKTILTAMGRFPKERHLVRWGALAVGYVIEDNKSHFDAAIDANVCTVIFDALRDLATNDEFVALGVMFCVAKLTQHDAFFGAIDYFVRAGIMKQIHDVFENLEHASEPLVLLRTINAVESILVAYPQAVGEAISYDFEELLSRVAAAHMTEPPIHHGVLRVMRLIGLANPEQLYPHLQVGDVA